ncbi:MAG: hypothetical protein A2X52_21560 [Candidatus Rokubacteria bacterium GWC2_70_16]|nr:MAG: hypothetical protein A2X52_21560 [Candidatus Rokubacteria bacterium GWC2_70_16]
MLDAFDFETQGRPTITICHDTFERAARNHATALGLPDLPLLVEPAPRAGNLTTDADALAERGLERVVAALTAR